MSYKIVIDSCGELLDEWKKDPRFESVALTLSVGGENIIDDENFDQASFLKKVADCPECPKSACPSPERYMRAFDCDADHVYAVTLSAELSGSYNSAVLGKSLLQEENPGKQIYVFNSKSASVGQSLIAMKIQECEEAGYSFEKVIETVEARGMNKALVKMAQNIVDKTKDSENKILAISHCNCRERAVLLKNALEERMPVKHIVILDTAGVSSMYANDGGVIVAV